MAVVFSETLKQEKESIVVGMGEIAVSASPAAVLSSIGLGSCIAVCAYDKAAKVGGMVHIVLPQHHGRNPQDYAKYADTAIPLLFNELVKIGGDKKRMSVKIAGGAQMTIAAGLRDTFKTGERNLVQILASLEKEGIGLAAADIGGNLGRTVRLYIGTGQVTVKTVSGTPRDL